MSKTRIDIPREKIAEFCRKNHICKLSLFGSVLHGNFGPHSDIDFLVEFDPDHIPGLIGLVGMKMDLTEILGHKVDMRTPEDLSAERLKAIWQLPEPRRAEPPLPWRKGDLLHSALPLSP